MWSSLDNVAAGQLDRLTGCLLSCPGGRHTNEQPLSRITPAGLASCVHTIRPRVHAVDNSTHRPTCGPQWATGAVSINYELNDILPRVSESSSGSPLVARTNAFASSAESAPTLAEYVHVHRLPRATGTPACNLAVTCAPSSPESLPLADSTS